MCSVVEEIVLVLALRAEQNNLSFLLRNPSPGSILTVTSVARPRQAAPERVTSTNPVP